MRPLLMACVLTLTMSAAASGQDLQVAMIGETSTYVVKSGDTVAAIAARFGVSTTTLTELNQLARPARIAPGQLIAIYNPHLSVVDPSVAITINVAQRMLFVVEDGRVSGFPITVGRPDWPTPIGSFTITEKTRDPVWHVPVSIQEEMRAQGKPVITRMNPSPDNPLGAHWLRLSISGLGIHGTNAPASIYRYGSHGCIRMHPDDIAWLFDRVSVATTGRLIYQPILLAAIDDRIWIEAHPDAYRRAPNALAYLKRLADRDSIGQRIDWLKVATVLRARAGRAEDVTRVNTTR
jgi:L,D-transpeptidase ErfK/SrfK